MQATHKKFRPGELAPITGIYRISHGTRHRAPHEVVIIRGEHLPTCRTCKTDTYFEIVRPISHITHDWDFSGPFNLVIRPKHDQFQDFRMFRRIYIQLPVAFQFPPSLGLIHGHTSDLSAGGVGVVIRDKLPSDHKSGFIRINGSQGRKPLSLRARLRYQTGLRYGFEFTHMTPLEREAVRRLIEKQTYQPVAAD